MKIIFSLWLCLVALPSRAADLTLRNGALNIYELDQGWRQEVGQRLRLLLAAHPATYEDLARELHCSTSKIAQLVAGKTAFLLEEGRQAAEWLDESPDALLALDYLRERTRVVHTEHLEGVSGGDGLSRLAVETNAAFAPWRNAIPASLAELIARAEIESLERRWRTIAGARLKSALGRLGYQESTGYRPATHFDLARDLGYAPGSLSNFTTGRSVLTLTIARKAAAWLGVTLDHLLATDFIWTYVKPRHNRELQQANPKSPLYRMREVVTDMLNRRDAANRCGQVLENARQIIELTKPK